jgi:hypothetical protein
MRVAEQEALLVEMVTWIKENQSKYEAGQWYFAGQLME